MIRPKRKMGHVVPRLDSREALTKAFLPCQTCFAFLVDRPASEAPICWCADVRFSPFASQGVRRLSVFVRRPEPTGRSWPSLFSLPAIAMTLPKWEDGIGIAVLSAGPTRRIKGRYCGERATFLRTQSPVGIPRCEG